MLKNNQCLKALALLLCFYNLSYASNPHKTQYFFGTGAGQTGISLSDEGVASNLDDLDLNRLENPHFFFYVGKRTGPVSLELGTITKETYVNHKSNQSHSYTETFSKENFFIQSHYFSPIVPPYEMMVGVGLSLFKTKTTIGGDYAEFLGTFSAPKFQGLKSKASKIFPKFSVGIQFAPSSNVRLRTVLYHQSRTHEYYRPFTSFNIEIFYYL